MIFTKTISTEFDDLKRRIVKLLRFGKNDVRTSFESSPFGVDSNPVEGMIALYGDTSTRGKTTIVGYIKPDQIAEVGELRLYSTDEEGTEQFYIHLKNNGECEMGGTGDYMVRFSALQEGFDTLVDEFNEVIDHYNTHAHGSSAPIMPPPMIAHTTADITDAEIVEVKTYKDEQ